MSLPPEWDGSGTGTTHAFTCSCTTFDFRIYPYITGGNSLESGYDSAWGGSYTFKVIDISDATRGFNTIPQPDQRKLIKEILDLAGKTGSDGTVIPKKGDDAFPGISTAKIDSITVKQEGAQPDVWLLTFNIQKIKYTQWKSNSKPNASSAPTVRDVFPWEKKPDINVSFSSETYNTGIGFYCGAKTPNEIASLIEANGNGLAALYVDNTTFEVMVNSAGDPFKSPPSTKVGVANFQVSASYEGVQSLTSLVNTANLAREHINNSAFSIDINATSFAIGIGTAMLTGFVVSPAEFTDKRDWLPKQQHPFGKTYAELGWEGNGVAYNDWDKTLQATEQVYYTVVKITFSVKEVGWGTAVADRGYRSLKTGILDSIKNNDGSKSHERLLDGAGIEVPEGQPTGDMPCFILYCPFGANDSLETLIGSLNWQFEDNNE